jgi:hypothetical protein
LNKVANRTIPDFWPLFGLSRRRITRPATVAWIPHGSASSLHARHRSPKKPDRRHHGRSEAPVEERSDLIRADLDRAEADPTYTSEWAGVAGATTGFIVKVVKTIGSGQNQQVITEFKLDKDLLEAFLAHEKQAAQELGQWIEKRDLTGQVDHTVTVDQLRRAIMLPASPTVEADFSEVAPE